MYGLSGFVMLMISLVIHVPSRLKLATRMRLLLARLVLVGVGGTAGAILVFPEAVGARIAFYGETILPNSPTSELQNRMWDYPVSNLLGAFAYPQWFTGYGTGTASLGGQYVTSRMGAAPSGVAVESGYGTLILEFGIVGPVLWLAWTIPLLVSGWQAVRKVRGTPLFPIAFSILWFVFLLLFPMTFGGMAQYQNYVMNAYLWLMVGVLFRLPDLADAARTQSKSKYLVMLPQYAR